MFDDDLTAQPGSSQSGRIAVGSSLVSHVLMVLLGLLVAGLPRSVASPGPTPLTRKYDLIWLASPGPGGGGGGGGERKPTAALAREIGKDRMTVPTDRPEPAAVEKHKEPPPTEQIAIPVKPLADTSQSLPGVIEAVAPGTTLGPGTDGGAGAGRGTGSGEGHGSGLGPGFGGGFGGGAYRPGNGVTSPQLVREVKPNYTVEAMRAKVQGIVLLECVVQMDGSVGDVKIVKSLDKAFGLDEEAIKAARQWRFVPGRRLGDPVPVYVTLELAFTLR